MDLRQTMSLERPLPSKVELLLKEYEVSKSAYDEALELVLSLGKLNFDSARLAARKRIRAAGLRDPDVIRWWMRFYLGFYPEAEEG